MGASANLAARLGGGYVLGLLVAATGPRRALRQRRLTARMEAGTARLYWHIWGEAASAVGAEFLAGQDGSGQIRRNGTSTAVDRHNTGIDDPQLTAAVLDKTRAHEQLTQAGLPRPPSFEYRASERAAAARFLSAAGGPCVVKPASGTGAGWGVTCAVADRGGLRLATLNAARYADRLLIEHQLPGDMYRLLFLDGRLLDVVRRRPPHVTGDGRSSIGELIDAENERRLALAGSDATSALRVDPDCLLTLRLAGRTLRTVPKAGEAVPVKTASSENRPEENVTVRLAPDAPLVDEARAAADAFGVRLAGIDVVTPDVTASLVAAGGAIIEVNGAPGLRYHYQVADRAGATPVAVPILRALLG